MALEAGLSMYHWLHWTVSAQCMLFPQSLSVDSTEWVFKTLDVYWYIEIDWLHVLQGDVSLLHNQMSRLLDTSFMYKATPAMPPTDTRSSPVKSDSRSPVKSPVRQRFSANEDVPVVGALMQKWRQLLRHAVMFWTLLQCFVCRVVSQASVCQNSDATCSLSSK